MRREQLAHLMSYTDRTVNPNAVITEMQYYYKTIECLNQTYQRRKEDWLNAEAPKKPAEDSPFGGPRAISKWQLRMFMWQQHKENASMGNVLHEFELRQLKGGVQAYLLSYLSEYGDKNHSSLNQNKIGSRWI